MQLKFNKQKTIGQSLGIIAIKIVLFFSFFALAVFLIEKVDFPSPEHDIKQDITIEVIKLK